MPSINEYKCNRCNLTLPLGWGYLFYVLDNKGKRITCGHPRERSDVERILGSRLSREIIIARTGFNQFCICRECLYQFTADLGVHSKFIFWSPFEMNWGDEFLPRTGRDPRICPICNSNNIKTQLELVGDKCPKCKQGTIEEICTGSVS